jgi:hypothetical protein
MASSRGTDAPVGADSTLLASMLDELRGMRVEMRALGERMAAHPDAEVIRQGFERISLLEQRELALRDRMAANEVALREHVAKADARYEAVVAEIHALKASGARSGVTTTVAQHVAKGVLGLVFMLIGAGILWIASMAGRGPAPVYMMQPQAPASAQP